MHIEIGAILIAFDHSITRLFKVVEKEHIKKDIYSYELVGINGVTTDVVGTDEMVKVGLHYECSFFIDDRDNMIYWADSSDGFEEIFNEIFQ